MVVPVMHNMAMVIQSSVLALIVVSSHKVSILGFVCSTGRIGKSRCDTWLNQVLDATGLAESFLLQPLARRMSFERQREQK